MNGFVAGQFRISKPETGFKQKATSYREYDAEQFQKSTGLARKRTTGTVMPRENTIHQGLVVCTKEYGAFVQLGKGEKYKDGFLHIGCLPNPPGVERVEVAIGGELRLAWGQAGSRALAADLLVSAVRHVRALRRLGIAGGGRIRASSPVAAGVSRAAPVAAEEAKPEVPEAPAPDPPKPVEAPAEEVKKEKGESSEHTEGSSEGGLRRRKTRSHLVSLQPRRRGLITERTCRGVDIRLLLAKERRLGLPVPLHRQKKGIVKGSGVRRITIVPLRRSALPGEKFTCNLIAIPRGSVGGGKKRRTDVPVHLVRCRVDIGGRLTLVVPTLIDTTGLRTTEASLTPVREAMAPRKIVEAGTLDPGFGVDEGAEITCGSPEWERMTIPMGCILEVDLQGSSVGLGVEGWFAILVDQVAGDTIEGRKVAGSFLGCESPAQAAEVGALIADGAVHLCPGDPCLAADLHVIHATKIRLWTLEKFQAEYITAIGKALLKKAEAKAKRTAKTTRSGPETTRPKRKPALRQEKPAKGTKRADRPTAGPPVISVLSGDDDEGESQEEEESPPEGGPDHLRSLLRKTKERILGGQAGPDRAPPDVDSSGGRRRKSSASAQGTSRLVAGTTLNPFRQTPLGLVPPGGSNDSGTRHLMKQLAGKAGAGSTLLAQAVQTSTQAALAKKEKKRKKEKDDPLQKLADILRGKGRKDSRKKRKSRKHRGGAQPLAIKPDPDPGDDGSDSSDSTGSSSGGSRKRLAGTDSEPELSCEPPLRKRALREPGSVMEMLIKHAQSQLDQGSLLDSQGAEPSLVSGVKISTYFALLIRPYHAQGPLLRELYALAQAIDLLRMGKLPECADALASRFVAVHTALSEGTWTTAQHLELYPLEPVASASTSTMLEAHRHRRLVLRSQGLPAAGNWWGSTGRGKGAGAREKGKKGEPKGRKGKGKNSQKDQPWGGAKGENPWKENKEEPPKK
eukprot:s1612_g7.t1